VRSGTSTANRIADLPVTPEMREDLLARGRARPHRVGSRGYVSFPIEDEEDVASVLGILGRNYDRAKAAVERRRAVSQNDEA